VNSELMLLNLIVENCHYSQRELAKLMLLSLGTINNMIQLFEQQHILMVQKESARQVAYRLTDKGKNYQNGLYVEYISECFDTVSVVRRCFKEKLSQLVDEGKSTFYVYGHTDELIRLAKMCFFELSRKAQLEYKILKELDLEQVQLEIEQNNKEKQVVVGWENKINNELSSLDYINLLS
jgi:DNA-binding MarR family transcriptional regulator